MTFNLWDFSVEDAVVAEDHRHALAEQYRVLLDEMDLSKKRAAWTQAELVRILLQCFAFRVVDELAAVLPVFGSFAVDFVAEKSCGHFAEHFLVGWRRISGLLVSVSLSHPFIQHPDFDFAVQFNSFPISRTVCSSNQTPRSLR